MVTINLYNDSNYSKEVSFKMNIFCSNHGFQGM